MKWKKFTLKTTTEAVDYISSLFDEIRRTRSSGRV